VKFRAADDTQFRVSIFYGMRESIENRFYNTLRVPRPTLMGTEVVDVHACGCAAAG
jgi:hypothetical protein